MTGKALPVAWGNLATVDHPRLVIGNAATHPSLASRLKYVSDLKGADDDVLNQSYLIASDIHEDHISINALGFGRKRAAREMLGMSYALGDLLRRLDIRGGTWGFILPKKTIIEKPVTPNRRLYLMNTFYINPGLALERFDEKQINDYVDMLVDAHYSQVTFFQWSTSYLYPGSFESLRPLTEMTHRAMRLFFDRARKRGMQVYQMITPAHIEPGLISSDARFGAKGFYIGQGACWSQPEVRDLAGKVAQLEMEYYMPVDGCTVWFYDPGGCFCSECKPNQADRIFDQLRLIDTLSKTVSPGAKMEAVLWPTWVFHETKGIDYTKANVDALVKSFLDKCLSRFGSRNMAVMDAATVDNSNIYNGLVNSKDFLRNGLLHGVMGATIEQAYPFAALRFAYTLEQVAKMQKHNLEAGTLTIGYASTNIPTVYTFADALYDGESPGDHSIRQYAASVAKGDSFKPYLALLLADDALYQSRSYKEMDTAITQMETQLKLIEKSRKFFGDKDWLRGFVKAQRWYWKLAQAPDENAFDTILSQFKIDVGSIPMYSDYMSGYGKVNKSMVAYAAGRHVMMYWRSLAGDASSVGTADNIRH